MWVFQLCKPHENVKVTSKDVYYTKYLLFGWDKVRILGSCRVKQATHWVQRWDLPLLVWCMLAPHLTIKTGQEENWIHLHWCEFVAHLEITVIIMSLSKRHHYIQVVLKTIDHLWYHQITGLVILQWEEERVCVKSGFKCEYVGN